MNEFFLFLEVFLKALPLQLMILMLLIVANLLLAVGVAIRTKKFDLKKLSDFYIRHVIPLLFGWLAFVILAHYSIEAYLGPTYSGLATDGVSWAAWLAVVGTLGAKIFENGKALYGSLWPLKGYAKQDPG